MGIKKSAAIVCVLVLASSGLLEAKKGENTKIKDRYIAGLKIKFEQHWKIFNSLKLDYCENLIQYPVLQEEYDKLAEVEQRAYQQWMQDKEAVFRVYKEISEYTQVKHPNEILGKRKEY